MSEENLKIMDIFVDENESTEKPILMCPLRRHEGKFRHCIEHRCAWFNHNEEVCGVLDISYTLNDISDLFSTISNRVLGYP
jgi:hypothetical protein